MGKGTKWGEARPQKREKEQRLGCEADKLASIDFQRDSRLVRSYATMHPEINLSISMHAELEWGALPHSTAPQGPP